MPGGGFIDAQEALRETSDDLLSDLDALSELEDEKRRTPHGDPRLVELAARVEEIAARVLAGSRRQLTLSQSVSDSAIEGSGDPTATITGTPRNLAEVLADWRAAERVARSAEPGSVEAEEARARAERLRQEYRDGFDDARRPDGT